MEDKLKKANEHKKYLEEAKSEHNKIVNLHKMTKKEQQNIGKSIKKYKII